ncbi:hypothetical protein SMD20_19525 [Nonomuraea sp. LP-02]|uniref:hypothetical protein n=1 Tax=Nonomuraea sp. LP-02 TaxID=3097960 RepID=UPI002E3527D5|nr:hypothetical protein [Nonomuraea sp. LP-02]MED7926455.1 hypothetical protein [Nonomuraea sp. LP-02]
MQDPTSPDRPEILSGPGDSRPANRGRGAARQKKTKKTAAIAAGVLVALIAAGGAGYVVASGDSTPATQQEAGRPGPSQGTGGDDSAQDDLKDDLQDDAADDATMGDARTDAPDDGLPDDGSMGDAATDSGSTGTTTSRDSSAGAGTKQTGDGKKSTTSPTKAPQSSEADNPADGPGGLVSGQCATSGC